MSALSIALVLSLLLIAAPHRLPLHRAAPLTAATVWVLALLLRALLVVGVTTFVLARVAHSHRVEAALDWCWHEVLPDVPGWIGFAEHPVAHAAVAVPLFAIVGALATQTFGGIREWVALRRRLSRAWSLGPHGPAVVPGDEIVVAVTRVGRGRVVVSDGALELMDEDELAAGMAHEFAHLRRRHRPVLLVGSLLSTIGCPLPGTARAARELSFQLERDADAWAVSRIRDPLSLASAICKVAGDCEAPGTASLAGRGPVTRRLAELLAGRTTRSRRVEVVARVLVAFMAGALLALALAAPAWAGGVWDPNSTQHCGQR